MYYNRCVIKYCRVKINVPQNVIFENISSLYWTTRATDFDRINHAHKIRAKYIYYYRRYIMSFHYLHHSIQRFAYILIRAFNLKRRNVLYLNMRKILNARYIYSQFQTHIYSNIIHKYRNSYILFSIILV